MAWPTTLRLWRVELTREAKRVVPVAAAMNHNPCSILSTTVIPTISESHSMYNARAVVVR